MWLDIIRVINLGVPRYEWNHGSPETCVPIRLIESLIWWVLSDECTFNGFAVGKRASIFLSYNTEACHEENCTTRHNCLMPTTFKYR